MKVTLPSRKLILSFITNKKLVIAATAIFFLSIAGISTYAIYQQQNTSKSTPIVETSPSQAKPKVAETTKPSFPASQPPEAVASKDSASSTPVTPQQNKPAQPDRSSPSAGPNPMPTGKTIWFNFPGTASYPSTLGTIQNAHDGDRARFVITGPNYSAGPWSDPVPAGSNSACQS